jgi:hypothetical protein
LNEGFSSVLAFQLMMLEREYPLACQKMHNTDECHQDLPPPTFQQDGKPVSRGNYLAKWKRLE